MTQSYQILYEKYGGFETPGVSVSLNGTELTERTELAVLEAHLTLSTGREAGAAELLLGDFAHQADLTVKLKGLFQLGNTVRVSLGYGKKRTQVFLGYLSGLDYELAEDCRESPVSVRLYCLDVKGLMMTACSLDAGGKQSALVRAVLDKAAYIPFIAKKETTAIPGAQDAALLRDGRSDWALLCEIAGRQGFAFYCAAGTLHFGADAPAGQPVCELKWGELAQTMTLSYSMEGLLAGTTLYAADSAGKRLSATAPLSRAPRHAGDRLHSVLPKQGASLPFPEARTPAALKFAADTRMRDAEKNYATARTESLGLPELLPGAAVTATGAGLGGKAVVTEAVHRFSEGSYRTECTLRLL